MLSWREAWRAELPEVSRSQARTLIVTLGGFWGCYALAVPNLEDGGIALVPFFVGFAAGWWFYLVLVRVWGTACSSGLETGPSGADRRRPSSL